VVSDPSDDPPPPFAAVMAARRALIATRTEREQALRDQLAAALRERDEAQRAFDAVADRDRRAGTARPAKLHELRKYVDVELAATSAQTDIVLRLEYQVVAARWAPSYVARLDGDRGTLEVRAVVAQDTGEDWFGVALELSTAEPDRFTQLPELAPQRIGRVQPEPRRPGFCPPPIGADALYADYTRSLGVRHHAASRVVDTHDEATFEGAIGEQLSNTLARGGIASEVWDDEVHAARAFSTPPEGVPQFAPAQAAPSGVATRAPIGGDADDKGKPAPKSARARSSLLKARAERPPSPPPGPIPRLDYGNLVMAPPTSPERGHLVPGSAGEHAMSIAQELATAQAKIAMLPLPPGHHGTWSHTYDYAFATDGAVDVTADATWHSIAVTSHATSVRLRHVSVPREQADVFRLATIANPFGGPLLPGPIDVYDRGRFLITSEVELAPVGSSIDVGLGVDPAIKIARNTEFLEEATGMLRGGLRLVHAITIDIDNMSPGPIELEVRERIPVKRDDDDEVEILIGKVDPPWERWTPDPDAPRDRRLRGAYRWKVSLPAGAKKSLGAVYEVRLASKLELVGGNRRES